MKFFSILFLLLPLMWGGVERVGASVCADVPVCDTLDTNTRSEYRQQKEQERRRVKTERRNQRVGSASTAESSSPRQALMVLPVSTYNFGDIRRKGGDLVKEFTFRNEGTAPLVLIRVITSCHCLRATFPRRPVAPGGEGKIKIVYEPNKSEEGMFNKVIQIYSNSAGGREIITVQGNSIDGELPARRPARENN